ALQEVLLVEGLGQAVAQRGLVHLALEVLVEAVVEGELEDGRGSDLDLVAVAERLGLDLLTVQEGAIGRAEIGDDDPISLETDRGVPAGDALVDDLDV